MIIIIIIIIIIITTIIIIIIIIIIIRSRVRIPLKPEFFSGFSFAIA